MQAWPNLYSGVAGSLFILLRSLKGNQLQESMRLFKWSVYRTDECEQGARVLFSVGKPSLLRLSWKGEAFKYGGWGKDPSPAPNKKQLYWVAPLNTDRRLLETFRVYESYEDLLLRRNPTDKRLTKRKSNTWDYTHSGQGGGMVMYQNNLFYNGYSTSDVCRFSMDTEQVKCKPLPNATYNNRFSYAGTPWQDLDFAVDENGLWVIYSTEENQGVLVLSKLNPTSLAVEKTWVTTQYKPVVTNAFMKCSVLYATRSVDTHKEEVFYRFDTQTGQGREVRGIQLEKMRETVQSLSYNPADQKLYMYNDGYLVTYDVNNH
nr:PREDICTED: olfactomedin-4-like [Latimeria chalumnae]|eukprot:XP_014348508.1 PREDICTED: olfactomedin-4-like [Latimeria chalumnae]